MGNPPKQKTSFAGSNKRDPPDEQNCKPKRIRMHGDAFRFRFLTFGQMNFQHIVFVAGFDLIRLDVSGHTHRSVRLAVAKNVPRAVTVDLGALPYLVLGLDHETTSRMTHIDLVRFKARSFLADDDFILGVLQVAVPPLFQASSQSPRQRLLSMPTTKAFQECIQKPPALKPINNSPNSSTSHTPMDQREPI